MLTNSSVLFTYFLHLLPCHHLLLPASHLLLPTSYIYSLTSYISYIYILVLSFITYYLNLSFIPCYHSTHITFLSIALHIT